VEGALSRFRPALTPEDFQELVARDDLVRVQQERGEQRALLGSGRSQVLSAGDDLERPEDSELHVRPFSHSCSRLVGRLLRAAAAKPNDVAATGITTTTG
jgi:hypothetical protein